MNEKIGTFIQRCHDLDYVILPEARTLFFDMSTGAQKSLIDILAEAISKLRRIGRMKDLSKLLLRCVSYG